MIAAGTKRVLVAGTCFEYGIQSGPLSEDLPTFPANPYGLAKDTLRKLLEALAAEEPLIAVFDDIQWGEDAFLDLLEHVAFLSTGAPILLLCMARPELLDRRGGWGGVYSQALKRGKERDSAVVAERPASLR